MLLIPTASQDVEGVGLHQDDDAERTQERVKKPNLPATSSSALSNVSGSCLAPNYSIPISNPDKNTLYGKEMSCCNHDL
jgi:hypothetical protein